MEEIIEHDATNTTNHPSFWAKIYIFQKNLQQKYIPFGGEDLHDAIEVATIKNIGKALDTRADDGTRKNGHVKNLIEEEEGKKPMKLVPPLLFQSIH